MEEPTVGLILARHGQSTANAAGIFTGRSDPPLTATGRDEARRIADQLIEAGLCPDRIFCAALDRCRETTAIIVETMGLEDCPVTNDPWLNERDYGLLTGRRKDEIGELCGADQLRRWRRSYTDTPPMGESLRDTAARVLRAYVSAILPQAMTGGTTLIISCGNALRALVMTLDDLDEHQIENFDISTGALLSYQLALNTAVRSRSTLYNRIGPE
ncbi:2,3-bisphosphoglycerate-dependent phosphoglycerate mutase [Sphingomonas sp. H39-1-10]|uniref:2,3-bisphosphoglycerate-dependent phosphoglycerate mutase n=1 Tax=Sphingomonas pollutisoli TaxID=3030829 RepID=UPI0023BA225B|nr:2,3-bisphosphoglycerate-dependent phosphoglycerate mutase [Sphingomonas pollutisoli]MDF0490537.1 2,3-bisphosphoglycerate-dependent phosphoglycerate mutase [Sphingomonas pollutisoli]